MGLDITAYSNCQFIEQLADVEVYEDKYYFNTKGDKKAVFVYALYVSGKDDFSSRAPELKPNGVYRYDESIAFRAGSYSGYNDWRAWLCETVNHVKPKQIWDNPNESKSLPFYELINFSDCEGIIGLAQSAELAKDFADYQSVAEANDDGWYFEQYKNWRKAFELAERGGFVYFH